MFSMFYRSYKRIEKHLLRLHVWRSLFYCLYRKCLLSSPLHSFPSLSTFYRSSHFLHSQISTHDPKRSENASSEKLCSSESRLNNMEAKETLEVPSVGIWCENEELRMARFLPQPQNQPGGCWWRAHPLWMSMCKPAWDHLELVCAQVENLHTFKYCWIRGLYFKGTLWSYWPVVVLQSNW